MGYAIASAATANAAGSRAGREAAASPSNAAQALGFIRSGLDWLASTDATDLTGAERTDCLRALTQAETVHLAATANIVSAFDAAEDYVADGQGGPRAWLRWQARLTRQAAASTVTNGDPETGIVDVPGARLAVAQLADGSKVGLRQSLPAAW